ncbi:restriction endonuclease [Sphingopyxis chilensis]|uniref:restriction endonuclease n=1 Tax=Sphingopyxis chilensis TaxID=180400 RepID=UPI002DDD3025|nr:restriction endonuclease [Sphingopyxis chilensis]
MSRARRVDPEWRQFEQLVSRLEGDAADLGAIVRSPDRIPCRVTGRSREVDASLRTPDGSLVTIECRKRRARQDVTWIEQLATKRRSIGAKRTIAVSASGFSEAAHAIACENAIELKELHELTEIDLHPFLGLDFVLFWHQRAEPVTIGLRFADGGEWTMPDPANVDFTFSHDTDLFAPIFRNIDEGHTWSLNDVWLQMQDAANPFAEARRGGPPIIRTAAFPYPRNVSVETPMGVKMLGDVIMTVRLWFEDEPVGRADATKVAYGGRDDAGHHRIEFASLRSADEQRVSLQTRIDANSIEEIKIGSAWPEPGNGQ